MGTFASPMNTDGQPMRCVICDEECRRGQLCVSHQGIKALAMLVNDGRLSDWPADEGGEAPNHRAMLTRPSAGPAQEPQVSWHEDLTRIARGYYLWQWLDD